MSTVGEGTKAPRYPDRRPVAGRALTSLVSAVVTALVFCASMALSGHEPFGPRSRLTNDLGEQFVPFHALLRDILTGKAPGDALFSWTSGAGVPFLPDLATYLTSPLAPLVVLFPRDRVDLAVFVITVLKMALAAGAMTWLLQVLKPAGPAWVAAGLGIAYGTCAWAVDDGAYVPMWLDGLAGLPLLLLVAHWSRQGRRLVRGTLVVALVWWANYYTAYMASIGAALFLVAELLADERDPRAVVAAIGRFALQGVLGVALTAVALLPTVAAVGAAQPTPPGHFRPHEWAEFAVRLLPASEGVGATPSLGVGTMALLLAATFAFCRAVPLRRRVVWVALVGALVVSMQVPFTQSAWHGFDVPNGSPFRQAFVVCAALVLMAWFAVADELPSPAHLAGGAILLAGVAWAAHEVALPRRALRDPLSLGVFALVAAVAVVLVLVGRRTPRLRAATTVALLTVLVAESTWSATVVADRRDAAYPTTAGWGTFAPAALAAADEARADSPPYRLAALNHRSANEPAVAGAPGVDYYSSTIPATTSVALTDLGARSRAYGRIVSIAPDDVALASILAVARTYSGHGAARPAPAMPFARIAPDDGPPTDSRPGAAPDAFALRARLLGSGVYHLPDAAGATRLAPGTAGTVTATCPAGTTVQLSLPGVKGSLRVAEGPGAGTRSLTGRDGVLTLGRAPEASTVSFSVISDRAVALPAHPVGCLDTAELGDVTAEARAAAPQTHLSGHGLEAGWSTPQDGTVVLATAQSPHWSCRADGRAAATSAIAGLLAVELDSASTLACTYRTPGLAAGLGVSAAAALLLAGLGITRVRVRYAARRRGRTTSARDA